MFGEQFNINFSISRHFGEIFMNFNFNYSKKRSWIRPGNNYNFR